VSLCVFRAPLQQEFGVLWLADATRKTVTYQRIPYNDSESHGRIGSTCLTLHSLRLRVYTARGVGNLYQRIMLLRKLEHAYDTSYAKVANGEISNSL
jgi:hypothetical protein